jgi:hypothetical protein
MKRIILIIILATTTFIIACLIIDISNKTRNQNQKRRNYKKLPVFELKTLGDTLFSSSTITEGPILVIYFHPECDLCQSELTEIFNSKLIDLGCWILMITPADILSVKKFMKEYYLFDNKKIITLIDDGFKFQDLFGKSPIPTNIIYSKDLKFYKMFKGEVSLEIIIKLLIDNDK